MSAFKGVLHFNLRSIRREPGISCNSCIAYSISICPTESLSILPFLSFSIAALRSRGVIVELTHHHSARTHDCLLIKDYDVIFNCALEREDGGIARRMESFWWLGLCKGKNVRIDVIEKWCVSEKHRCFGQVAADPFALKRMGLSYSWKQIQLPDWPHFSVFVFGLIFSTSSNLDPLC